MTHRVESFTLHLEPLLAVGAEAMLTMMMSLWVIGRMSGRVNEADCDSVMERMMTNSNEMTKMLTQ
jgi:hypothetical protein